jgi:hypothetical protein
MTNRQSQVEKFNARAAKMKADAEAIRLAALKRSAELDNYEKEGERVMKEAAPTEEVFAVIARSGMESFMKVWNNSMETVIRETVRTEVRSMIQEELQAAMKGMFQGMNEAVTGVIKESVMPKVEEELVEKVSGPLSQRIKAEMEEKQEPQYNTPRYSKERIITCGKCGATGHNKRTCTVE